jgi:PTH2 family peptidyl-tRNA hydrolase
MIKQYIVARKDLKLSHGKLAAQASHASVNAFRNVQKHGDKEWIRDWDKDGHTKVVLKVSDAVALHDLIEQLPSNFVSVIVDAGRTEIEAGTMTCIGIGPIPADQVEHALSDLKLYS